MAAKLGSWKLERASVHRKGATRARSNKYSGGDDDVRPAPHTRSKVWVGSYKRADGRRVEGHFRFLNGRPKSTTAKAVKDHSKAS